jgi:hypothetical protein
VGAFIWVLRDGRRRGVDVVDAVVAPFEIDRATAAAVTVAYLTRLLSTAR